MISRGPFRSLSVILRSPTFINETVPNSALGHTDHFTTKTRLLATGPFKYSKRHEIGAQPAACASLGRGSGQGLDPNPVLQRQAKPAGDASSSAALLLRLTAAAATAGHKGAAAPARQPARDPQPATAAGGPARRPQTLPAEFTLLEAGLVRRRRRPRGFSLLLHRHRFAPAGGRPAAGARRLGPPSSALRPLLFSESGGASGPVSPRRCWSPPRWAGPGRAGSGRAGPRRLRAGPSSELRARGGNGEPGGSGCGWNGGDPDADGADTEVTARGGRGFRGDRAHGGGAGPAARFPASQGAAAICSRHRNGAWRRLDGCGLRSHGRGVRPEETLYFGHGCELLRAGPGRGSGCPPCSTRAEPFPRRRQRVPAGRAALGRPAQRLQQGTAVRRLSSAPPARV